MECVHTHIHANIHTEQCVPYAVTNVIIKKSIQIRITSVTFWQHRRSELIIHTKDLYISVNNLSFSYLN